MKIDGVNLTWDEAWSVLYIAKIYGISRQAVNAMINGRVVNGVRKPGKFLPDEVLRISKSMWLVKASAAMRVWGKPHHIDS